MPKENKYVCVMFPYPSGAGLHVGHYYNYAIVDSYCRYLRYRGQEVFQPFGYDAFGLPAENYAKSVGRNPKEVTYENIDSFRKQMEAMNTQYEELLITSDPSYQKWTQWIFNQLLEHGLAYKAKGDVNYCGSCETVLANEQVKDNHCERCDSEVESKEMEQWYFKITKYADRLLENLDSLDFPEKTKQAQRNWIGKSIGYEIDFGNNLIVFTTKPETIKGVKFIVTSSKNGQEEFTGKYTTNPVTGEQIPIWTAPYVLENYGSGFVMGVPSDDPRDRKFAERNGIDIPQEIEIYNEIYEHEFVKQKINYKLKDWCVSRQRNWGCPIPIEGEVDTLDTFVDSSFYYVRYCDPNNEVELCSKEKYKQVDLYVGGSEHACMHLIYTRFIHMFLYDIGFVPCEEPFKKLIHQGMITNQGNKMSKSKGNAVNPDEYESGELRFYLMFIGHYFDGGAWSDGNINGVKRFIKRWKTWSEDPGEDSIEIENFKQEIFNYTESFKFNKVVSSFMTFYNKNKNKKLTEETFNQLNDLLKIYIPSL